MKGFEWVSKCERGCVLGERIVWSVLYFDFEIKHAKVTVDWEVGYKVVIEWLQVGKVSKMKPQVSKLNLRQTTGG